MTSKEFAEQTYAKAEGDYGIIAPPTKAQEGLDVLIEHFLGSDWYATGAIHTAQVNTEAIYEILEKYPGKRKSLLQRIREQFNNIKGGTNK